MDIPNVVMNVSSMSDTELTELFELAFAEQVAEINDIEDPEVECERDGSQVKMYVNLYGMAGSPTVDTYRDAESIDTVQIARADKGRLSFSFVEARALGGNEYQVVYVSQ